MNLSTLKLIIRHFGVGWVAYRAWKSVSEKLGYWKFKLPSKSWDEFASGEYAVSEKTLGYASAAEFFEQRDLEGIKFFFDPSSIGPSRQ